MSMLKHSPGRVRDAIVDCLVSAGSDASVAEIKDAIEARLGDMPASSVHSYLRLRPDMFEQTERGRYRLREAPSPAWALLQGVRPLAPNPA